MSRWLATLPDLIPGDGWTDGLVGAAAVVTASWVLYTKALAPMGRNLRRGWRAMIAAGERWDDIPSHTDQLAAITGQLDTMATDIIAIRQQQSDDHAWTHGSLEAVAAWSEQFPDYEPIQLPDREMPDAS